MLVTDPRKPVFDAIRAGMGRIAPAHVPIVDEALDRIGFPRADGEDAPGGPLAWGAKVSAEFRARVRQIATNLRCDASDLMACIAWETGMTFSPSVTNMAGSGATGLIQFMPQTARMMGTSVEALAEMSAVEQLDYVERYFSPFRGKLGTLADLYMAILWPAAVGKPVDYVLWDKASRPTTYRQNAGLDADRDGRITKAECAVKLNAMRVRGLVPENAA